MSAAAHLKVGPLNSSYGSCWIYNESLNQSKKIKKTELENWLNQGWVPGRKMQYKSAESKARLKLQLNTLWITNGINSKQIPKTTPIPAGWHKGRINTWTKKKI